MTDFRYAPFACRGGRRPDHKGDDEKDLSNAVDEALSRSVRLGLYPKSVININILVIQADGGVLGAAITCASLAIVRAGIECFDVVPACTAMRIGKHIALDPGFEEEIGGDAEMTLAYLPNLDRIAHVMQSGRLLGSQSMDAIDLCVDGCRLLYKLMRHALLPKNTENT